MLKDLSRRSHDPEIMDNLEQPLSNLEEVLDDINQVNQLLGGFKITIHAVEKLIKEYPKKSYTIVDFGCAEGKMLRLLAKMGRRKGHKLKLIGIDLNQDSISIARARSSSFPEISYLQEDIFKTDFNQLECDIIICTLTMHHFDDGSISKFISHFIKSASIGIIINDLQRSAIAYYLFTLFSVIFIKTRVAKIDGLISIRRGFRKSELMTLASRFPEATHQIQWKWAFRYLWIIQKMHKIKTS
ncbi:methyltransferase domain-containing protein [Flavobacteriaceae bacterium M23B6Z8]